MVTPAYQDTHTTLYLADSFEILKEIDEESVDVVVADPPYFLSTGGITCSNGTMVPVDKGEWDKQPTLAAKHKFNLEWIYLCRRILKPNGTIWVSGTLHNIYSVGVALEQLKFKIMNNITWQKTNPPPNLSCRYFVHSTETIIWAKKIGAKHLFNYELMRELNGGKQMRDVWSGTLTPPKEKTLGKHPTQKPLYLIKRILMASTQQNDLVLDPFCGSGTTGVACKILGRRFVGIDNNPMFIELAKQRITGDDIHG